MRRVRRGLHHLLRRELRLQRRHFCLELALSLLDSRIGDRDVHDSKHRLFEPGWRLARRAKLINHDALEHRLEFAARHFFDFWLFFSYFVYL